MRIYYLFIECSLLKLFVYAYYLFVVQKQGNQLYVLHDRNLGLDWSVQIHFFSKLPKSKKKLVSSAKVRCELSVHIADFHVQHSRSKNKQLYLPVIIVELFNYFILRLLNLFIDGTSHIEMG